MSTTTGADLCRVSIVSPHRRLDLSLPADVPLAYILPPLLRIAGPHLANAGTAHSGWVLQRLDEPPLDESQTLTSLDVHDGEVLYFRPQLAQLPEVVFDDVADVVATGVNEHTDRWRPETTRGFGLLTAPAVLVTGAAVLLLTGPPWGLAAVAAGVVAVVLLAAGTVLARAVGDAGAGSSLGFAALPYAFVAGLLAPARANDLTDLNGPHLMAALGAATLAAVLAAVGIVAGQPVFLGLGLAAFLGTVATALTVTAQLDPGGTAAFLAALSLTLTALIPSLAVRLSRLPLPPVPENVEELRGAQTFDGPTLLRRTREADRFATGLVAGASVTVVAAHLCLIPGRGWLPLTMGGCLALASLLRARIFHGRAQRIWLLSAGLAGLGLLALRRPGELSPALTLAAVLVPLLAGAAVIMTMALRLPARKPSPFWGRAGDILDLIVILSLFPLAMGLLEFYGWLRGLAG